MNKLKSIITIIGMLCLPIMNLIAQVSQTVEPDVSITNLNFINSDALDFSPTFYQEGIVFVSSRNIDRKIDKKIGEPFFDLYYADLNPKGIPGPPQQFSVRINSKLHEGPVTFNKTGDKIFFSKNNVTAKNKPIPNSKGIVQQSIYMAKKGSSEWENIEMLPFNNTEYSFIHPSISVDNKRLYFASDMPGGEGGMDIYYSDFKNGSWSQPINAGRKVNTRFDEVFPFIHNSGIVYFSTNKPGGMGGFDIYRLMPDENIPTALLLGAPFNSSADDIGLVVSDKGTTGFFTSARESGKDDVYSFDAPNGLRGIPQPTKFLNTNFMVYDMETEEPISNAGIALFGTDQREEMMSMYDVELKNTDENEMGIRLTLNEKGRNAFPNLYTDQRGMASATVAAERQYHLIAKKEGYQPQHLSFENYNKTNGELIRVGMRAIKKEIIEKSVVIEEGATIVADKIFYDFDKSFIRQGAAYDLDAIVVLLNKYKDIEIDLIAHTDSRGTVAYNQKLSENRAISAKNYLITHGIDGNRIKTFGKGESTPRNGCKDGVRCSELEHQYNRRTEIYIRKMNANAKIELKDNQPETVDAMRD